MKTRRIYKLPDYEDFQCLKFTRRELKKFLHRHKNLFDSWGVSFDRNENPYWVKLRNISRKPMRASVCNVARGWGCMPGPHKEKKICIA